MPIIQDAAPDSVPQNTVPLGSPFTIRSQVHAAGAAENVRVRYSLNPGPLVFSAGKSVEFPVRVNPTATLVEHELIIASNGGAPPAQAVVTIEFLRGGAVLSTSTLRVFV